MLNPAARPGRGSAIVLAAGRVDTDLASVLNCYSPLMLPFRGKPAVYWQLTELESRGITDVYFAVNEIDDRAERFVKIAFAGRVNCHFFKLRFDPNKGPGNSLIAVAREYKSALAAGPVLVVNGDVIFSFDPDRATRDQATIWTTALIDSDKYTFVAFGADQRVLKTTLKLDKASGGGARHQLDQLREEYDAVLTEAGLYSIGDTARFFDHIDSIDPNRAVSVTTLFNGAFGTGIFARPLESWWDASHLDSLLGVADKGVAPRHFNAISVDDDGVFHKTSRNQDKIRAEIQYYRELPRELQIHFPRLVDADPDQGRYAIEYYPYKTLSEYLVFQGLSLPMWRRAFGKLMSIGRAMSRHERENRPDQLHAFYWNKTRTRYAEARAMPHLAALLSAPAITCNGRRLKGFEERLGEIEADLHRVVERARPCVVHGDLCFSNILFDPSTTLVRLIDPRGEFTERGCFGDPRYDLAKLLHSVHGRYDFILHGLYGFSAPTLDRVELQTITDDRLLQIEKELFAAIAEAHPGELRSIVLLEALLFIAMVPLHAEDPNRQKAFYVTGLRILSEIYDENLY